MFRAAKTTTIATMALTAMCLMLSSCGGGNDSLDTTIPTEQTTDTRYDPPIEPKFGQETEESPSPESNCYSEFGGKDPADSFPCYDRWGYDRFGRDRDGYDRNGYDIRGYDKDGYPSSGRDVYGYDRDGYDRDGYDKDGLNKDGYDSNGYDSNGYNRMGQDEDGFNRSGRDSQGYDREGCNRLTFTDKWGNRC